MCPSRSTSSSELVIASRTASGSFASPAVSSSSPRRMASGVRSSWLASSTKARSRANAASMRSSIALSVWPRRASSWSPTGSGSRRPGSDIEIAAASSAMRSTGRSAAPVTIHTTTPSAITRSGAPSTSEKMTRRRASCSVASDAPTITTTSLPRNGSGRATRRPCDASAGILRSTRTPLRIALASSAFVSSRRFLSMFAVDDSTRPSDSTICANASSWLSRTLPCDSAPSMSSSRARSPSLTARSSARSRLKASNPLVVTTMSVAPTHASATSRARSERNAVGRFTPPSLTLSCL